MCQKFGAKIWRKNLKNDQKWREKKINFEAQNKKLMRQKVPVFPTVCRLTKVKLNSDV